MWQGEHPVLVCEQGWRGSYDFSQVLIAYMRTHTAGEIARVRVKRASPYNLSPVEAVCLRCMASLRLVHTDGAADAGNKDAMPAALRTLQQDRYALGRLDRDPLTALWAYNTTYPPRPSKRYWQTRIQESIRAHIQMSPTEWRQLELIQNWQSQKYIQSVLLLQWLMFWSCYSYQVICSCYCLAAVRAIGNDRLPAASEHLEFFSEFAWFFYYELRAWASTCQVQIGLYVGSMVLTTIEYPLEAYTNWPAPMNTMASGVVGVLGQFVAWVDSRFY